jgi:hypothetical protein
MNPDQQFKMVGLYKEAQNLRQTIIKDVPARPIRLNEIGSMKKLCGSETQ